ncbi:unnamed protein product [Soboliphyme baturini]|uniref:Nuclear cap-binding protein subunit 3 n=1 Tax=Soboliphyme baturini TaxID=241478 RepID=A0A183IM42_9BILA|nr:unnamed protein product [Soboliphyme baturini]
MEVDENRIEDVLLVEDSSEFKLGDELKDLETVRVGIPNCSIEEESLPPCPASSNKPDDASGKHRENFRTDQADIGDVSFVNDEENRRKRVERAKRFGLDSPYEEDNEADRLPVSFEDIRKVYTYFDVDPDNPVHKAKYRFDALFVYGLSEMSTEEVADFFKDDRPNAIEWINDQSCIIAWNSTVDAVRCLLSKSYFV